MSCTPLRYPLSGLTVLALVSTFATSAVSEQGGTPERVPTMSGTGFLSLLGFVAVLGILLWLVMILIPGWLADAKWRRKNQELEDQRLAKEGWSPEEIPFKKDQMRETDKAQYGVYGYLILVVSFGLALFAYSLL